MIQMPRGTDAGWKSRIAKTRKAAIDGDGPAAEHAPHVLRRDVPPPAVVEAEGEEDRQHDPDHEDDDVPLQVAVVVDGPVAVEADVPGEHPCCGDQRSVDGDLPQTMPVDRRAHDYAGTPRDRAHRLDHALLLLRVDASPHRESEILSRGALGLGQRAFRDSEVAHRGLQMGRRRVVRGARDPRLAERLRDLGPARRADDVQVVDVARLVQRAVRPARRARAPRIARRPHAVRRSSPRAAAGRRAASPPARHRAASSSRRARRSSCRASRGSAASERARPPRRRGTSTSPPSPKAKRFLVGKKLNVEQIPVCATPCGAERLRRVLDEREAERGELGELRRAAEQVHGHDRLRARRDPRGDVLRIEVQRHRVDVGEDRRRADARDRLGRRVERERRADRPRRRDRSRAPRARGRARRCRSRRRSRAARRGTRRPRARTPPPRARR